MTYKVILSPAVQRILGGTTVPTAVIDAALVFINGDLAETPKRVGKRMTRPPLIGSYSARRADYRILYRITGDTVVIDLISHRGDSYRRR